MILGGEDVAGHPADLGAQAHERLDQHRGLHGHVQRPGDPRPVQRARLGVLPPQLHQTGHLVLGQPDLLAAELRKPEIGDGEVDAASGLQPAADVGSGGHGVVTPPLWLV
jgi:hypothetical protein